MDLRAEKPLDGRRARTADSRARIIQAMLALVEAGDPMPSADAVAAKAGVGRRTVFRIFRDMDSVYAQMHAEILRRVAPILDLPLDGETRALRLQQLIDRRVRLFEEVLALKLAADLSRHRSDYLRDTQIDLRRTLRQFLSTALSAPPAEAVDFALFEALDAVLSIDFWKRLRRDQGLDVADADAILRRTTAALLTTLRGP